MTNDYGNLELHKVLLEALKDFDAICKKYNLQYILHGGSCLGAVRHKGFIPWDDDVDIAMPRRDYEKFLKIPLTEFGDKYTIHTYITEPRMIANVMKIMINNSEFIDSTGVNENGGAFLDVFPMSDVPNSKILRTIQKKITIFLNNCVYAKLGYIQLDSWKSKLVYGTISKVDRKILGNVLEVCIKRFPHYHSKYVNIVATANYNGCTGYEWDLIPKAWVEERKYTAFEDTEMPISIYWEEYLTSRYGDYMVPPSEEKRINKHNIRKKEVAL